MSGRVRAAVIVALIVVSSAIVGAAIERTVIHARRRPPQGQGGPPRGSAESEARRRNGMLDRMTKDLSLTPEQRVAIDSIMQRTDSSMRVIRGEMQPRIESVFVASRANMRARLSPEQQAKFEQTMRSRGRGRGGRQ